MNLTVQNLIVVTNAVPVAKITDFADGEMDFGDLDTSKGLPRTIAEWDDKTLSDYTIQVMVTNETYDRDVSSEVQCLESQWGMDFNSILVLLWTACLSRCIEPTF